MKNQRNDCVNTMLLHNFETIVDTPLILIELSKVEVSRMKPNSIHLKSPSFYNDGKFKRDKKISFDIVSFGSRIIKEQRRDINHQLFDEIVLNKMKG